MSNTRCRLVFYREKDIKIHASHAWGTLSRSLIRDKPTPNTRCRLVVSRENDKVYVFKIIASSLRGFILLAQRYMWNGLR